MIQQGTLIKITDHTGISLVMCIKALYSQKRKIVRWAGLASVSVRKINTKRFYRLDTKKKSKFIKGTLHKVFLIRSKKNFNRVNGVYIKFNENSGILVNKKKVPISTRVNGPVLKEFCMKIPSLGCITRYMI